MARISLPDKRFLRQKELKMTATTVLGKGTILRWGILFFVPMVMFPVPGRIGGTPLKTDPYQPVHESWERFGAVFSRVVTHYYDDVNHSRLMRAAIEGLLRELDSYSQYFDEDGLRQLRQDTTGRFAGLGITVGIKDHYPVVIAPMEGTPAIRAGLLPGDLIVAIEGEDSFDLSLEEVVNTLRGEPGSVVRITVARPGHSQWDVVITRELIKIRSVALADLIHPQIGYISMKQTRFSEDTAFEVEQALKKLSSSGIEALVLDLRGNPGGLLTQAAEVADLFLSKGDPIVSIRERDGGREETRYSQRPPVYAEHPMVVLIDGGSASAAEIVAGAIQDNDRGLVVGKTSFGKGSVQTIFDLHEQEDTALKLTTALYYTPSGRSIHRDANDLSPFRSLQIPVGEIEVPAVLLLNVLLEADDYPSAHADLRARFDVEAEEAHQLLQLQLGDLVGRKWAELPVEAGIRCFREPVSDPERTDGFRGWRNHPGHRRRTRRTALPRSAPAERAPFLRFCRRLCRVRRKGERGVPSGGRSSHGGSIPRICSRLDPCGKRRPQGTARVAAPSLRRRLGRIGENDAGQSRKNPADQSNGSRVFPTGRTLHTGESSS